MRSCAACRSPPPPSAELAEASWPAWSPNGRQLALVSGSTPAKLTLFDLTTGRASVWRASPKDKVVPNPRGLTFTADGRRLCTYDADATALQCPWAIGSDGAPRLAPPTRSSQTFIQEETQRTFDVPLRLLEGDSYHVVELSTDGRRLAHLRLGRDVSEDAPNRLELYDATTWKLECTTSLPQAHGGIVDVVTFSPTGDTVTATSGGKRHVVEISTCRDLGELDAQVGGDPNTTFTIPASYRPDGGAVASGTGRLDTHSGKVTKLVPDIPLPPKLMLSTSSAERLLLVGHENKAHIVRPDLARGTTIPISFTGLPEYSSWSFSTDGSRVIVADRAGVRLMGTAPFQERALATHVDARSAAISADGSRLAWGQSRGSAASIHIVTSPDGGAWATTPPPAKLIPVAGMQASNLCFDPRGERLAWVGGGFAVSKGELAVADLASGAVLWTAPTEGGVAFSPDGARLASGFRVFDSQSGKVLSELHFEHPVFNLPWLTFSPDGQRIAFGTSDRVAVWRAATGELVWQRELAATGGAFGEGGHALLLATGAQLLVVDPTDGHERLAVSYASELAARAQTPDGHLQLFGTQRPTGELCMLGARVLPFEICEASLGGARQLWRGALTGDPSAIDP